MRGVAAVWMALVFVLPKLAIFIGLIGWMEGYRLMSATAAGPLPWWPALPVVIGSGCLGMVVRHRILWRRARPESWGVFATEAERLGIETHVVGTLDM